MLFSLVNLNPHPVAAAHPIIKAPEIAVPIVCYHRVISKTPSIYDLTPAMLEQQFKFFKDHGYHPITALQYLNLRKTPALLPAKPVVLSFDDGNKSHYLNVFPLLKKYGYKATFFIYPSAVLSKSTKYITWGELAEMAQAGMDIECHTMYHPYLVTPQSHLTDPAYLKWLDYQLKDSKDILEQKLKISVKLLAYPYGIFDDVVENKAKEAGYEGIFTVNSGTNSLTENPLRLKRRIITNQTSIPDLERFLNTKPLQIEIISPADTKVISEDPVTIQFRLKDPQLSSVKIEVRNNHGILNPNPEGIFTYQLKNPHSGYHMIIISGDDNRQNHYVSSWSFDYRKPVAGNIPPAGDRDPSDQKLLILNAAAQNQTISLHAGEIFKVVLAGNPTTGYQWETVPGDSAMILGQIGPPEYQPDTPQVIGSGGKYLFSFKAIAVGKTKLKLIYHRPWEKNTSPLGTYEINVVVE